MALRKVTRCLALIGLAVCACACETAIESPFGEGGDEGHPEFVLFLNQESLPFLKDRESHTVLLVDSRQEVELVPQGESWVTSEPVVVDDSQFTLGVRFWFDFNENNCCDALDPEIGLLLSLVPTSGNLADAELLETFELQDGSCGEWVQACE